MPHPKETKRFKGKIWHKEDSKLTLVDARALKRHLKKTEDKNARITHTPKGYEVWWASR